MKTLFEPHVGLVGKVMDMQLQRQNIIMGNIANVNTPKYKTRTLEFEDQLQKALGLDMNGKVARTDTRHLPVVFNAEGFSGDMEIAVNPKVVYGEDRVNLDKEMTKMAKNNLQYNALTQIIKGNLDGVRTAIMEGSK